MINLLTKIEQIDNVAAQMDSTARFFGYQKNLNSCNRLSEKRTSTKT